MPTTPPKTPHRGRKRSHSTDDGNDCKVLFKIKCEKPEVKEPQPPLPPLLLPPLYETTSTQSECDNNIDAK